MFRTSDDVKRALLKLACVLLLFAQHMGLAHAIWHAAQPIQTQQERVEERRGDQPISPEVSRLCALDAAFAQVLGGAPLSRHDFSAQTPAAVVSTQAPLAFASSEQPAPRSRGPPALF